MSMVSAPGIVLFDWDNTLLDAWGIIHSCLMDTCRHFGKEEWAIDNTISMMELSPSGNIEKIFGNQAEEAMHYYRACFRKHKAGLFLLPGAKKVVDLLYKHKIPMSIVSNKYGTLLREEVEQLGLGSYFHRIIGAGDENHDKPSKDVVHAAIALLDPQGSIWFVGDTIIDMECAYVSGCLPVLYGHGKAHIFTSDYQPKVHVKTHKELLNLLQDIL